MPPFFRTSATIASAVFTALILSACVPQVYSYWYMSLENVSGVDILEYGTPDLGWHFFHETMPIRYRIDREKYHLLFEVDRGGHRPNLRVTAISLDGRILRLSGKGGNILPGCMGIAYYDIVRGYLSLDPPEDPLRPYKLEFNYACKPTGDRPGDAMRMIIRIVSNLGDVFAEESIPFELKKNGLYMIMDAV